MNSSFVCCSEVQREFYMTAICTQYNEEGCCKAYHNSIGQQNMFALTDKRKKKKERLRAKPCVSRVTMALVCLRVRRLTVIMRTKTFVPYSVATYWTFCLLINNINLFTPRLIVPVHAAQHCVSVRAVY